MLRFVNIVQNFGRNRFDILCLVLVRWLWRAGWWWLRAGSQTPHNNGITFNQQQTTDHYLVHTINNSITIINIIKGSTIVVNKLTTQNSQRPFPHDGFHFITWLYWLDSKGDARHFTSNLSFPQQDNTSSNLYTTFVFFMPEVSDSVQIKFINCRDFSSHSEDISVA